MNAVTVILGFVVALMGGVAIAGAVVGQFRRGVVDELRASLSTAQSEIEIQRGRGDRLEAATSVLTTKVAALTAENSLLSMQLKSGMRLAPEFQQILTAQMDEYQRRMEQVLQAGWSHRDHQEQETLRATTDKITQLFNENDERVQKRHRALAEHLPEVTRTALIKALDVN